MPADSCTVTPHDARRALDLPHAIAELVDVLAAMPGAVAVVLGGSRVAGTSDADSDWDLGLYYRGTIDLAALAAHGPVHPPGAWGRIMNGGAWLRCGDASVDVLLRDLDVVEHWTRRAQDGDYEVEALLGYLAGVPTYVLTAELASCRVLRGDLPRVEFPPRLAEVAPARWRFARSFSLDYARKLARRGDIVGATGQAAKAVLEEGHAILCARSRWTCNEKRLVEDAGLADAHFLFRAARSDAGDHAWLDLLARRLGASPDELTPWSDAGRAAAGSRAVRR